MKKAYTLQGQSFVFNALFILINLAGVTMITIGFHEKFENFKWLYLSIGLLLLAFSIVGLVIFKGRLFMSYVARVLVGGLFIVSGLIKANDPLGFSYKLEEYFEDGALAFRIKEWFNMPDFSLEFFIPWALTLSIIICIVEIVLGVLVLIGGKMKLVSWLLLGTIIFFTFLTWHTANCDANTKFVDRDTYDLSSEIAKIKMTESKTNKEIKIVSKANGKLVVDEMKQPQCVLDCGCFGDAMKGSVGRSLTPKESLWKDLILFYLIIWIFISQKRILPNSSKDNAYIVPISLIVIAFFSFIFSWYFPLIFSIVAIFGALWILKAGGKFTGNYFGSTMLVTVLSGFMILYVMMYEPIKDYRPYAVGSDLKAKMLDGKMGVFESGMLMKNKTTGKEEFLTQEQYMDTVRKIWEDKNYELIRMDSKEIVKGKLPSIDSAQFNPTVEVSALGKGERNMKFISELLEQSSIDGVLLLDVVYNNEIEVPKSEYNKENYDSLNYKFIRDISMINPELAEISVRDYLLNAPTAIVLFSKNLKDGDFSDIDKLKHIYKEAAAMGIPFLMICSGSRADIDAWRKKFNFDIPAFGIDFIEMKVISRSNPSLMILQKGVVKGKYPSRSLPKFDWIQKHVLNKK